MMLPLIVSEKPVDPKVAEVMQIIADSPSRVPVNRITSPVPLGVLKVERVDYWGISVEPRTPETQPSPDIRSTTMNVGLDRDNRCVVHS